MKEKRKRPNYTKEFKQDAVKLVIEQQYSCPEVGRRLGVAASNVTRWMRQYREDQQDLSDGGVTRRDQADDPHLRAALRAGQGIDLPDLLYKLPPCL